MKGFILIGGAPSSGSTLLMNLLAKQPDLLCLPETGLFSHGRNLVDLAAPVDARPDLGWHLPWLLTAHKVAGALGWKASVYEEAGQHHKTAFDLLETRLPDHSRSALVEKTPENVFAFREYLSMSPDNRVIVTSRDLLGGAQSLARRDFNLVEAILTWFSHSYETARLLADFPDQVFHCRYGELTSEPDRVMQRLLAFLPAWARKKTGFSSAFARAAPQPPPTDGGIGTLLKVSAWKLTDTVWSYSPDDAPRENRSPNLFGLDFEMLRRSLLFRPSSSSALYSPAALDEVLARDGARLLSEEAEGVPVACELTSTMTRALAEHYVPHLRRV